MITILEKQCRSQLIKLTFNDKNHIKTTKMNDNYFSLNFHPLINYCILYP